MSRLPTKAFKTKYPDPMTAPRWCKKLRNRPTASFSLDKDVDEWLKQKRETFGTRFNASFFVNRILRVYMRQEAAHAKTYEGNSGPA